MDLNLFKVLTIVLVIMSLFKVGYIVKFIVIDGCMENIKSKRAIFIYGVLVAVFLGVYFYYVNLNNSEWSLVPLLFIFMSLDGMATSCGLNNKCLDAQIRSKR